MSDTPREVLERFAKRINVSPGLSEQQLAVFEAGHPGSLPADIKELLTYSVGFETTAARFPGCRREADSNVFVSFTDSGSFQIDFLPSAINLLGDGVGNFWIVDVSPHGEWGAVMFVCHDPPVIAVQARNLAGFLAQILEGEQNRPGDALNYVHNEAVTEIWRCDPWLAPEHDPGSSRDSAMREFVNKLPERFSIVDLRPRAIGSGFSWGRAGPNTRVYRDPTHLLFGVEKRPPNLIERFFRRGKLS